MLAQSATDISAVPADFVKWFIVMTVFIAGFVIVIGLQLYNAFFRGPQKREISGRVVNEDVPEFADADDVDGLRHDVEQDKSAISGRIAEMQQSFTASLHSLGNETLRSMGEIKNMASRHDALLQQFEHRLTNLEKSHNEAVSRLHSRIDDSMTRKRP